jgi:hypothetical protein
MIGPPRKKMLRFQPTAPMGIVKRRWKLELVEPFNPEWRDTYETLNN